VTDPGAAQERWRRLDDLFQRALDLDPSKRGAFLDEACSSDPALMEETGAECAGYARLWAELSPDSGER
jgi:hypothetical protein